jgi:hypothetical protein
MPVTAQPDDWSPADSPYAIALSETQWSLWTLQLCARRIHEGKDPERQIDARQFVAALRQIERFAKMERNACHDATPEAAHALGQAIEVFTAAVPGARHARDVLEHYDAYSVGKGHKQASAPSQEAARDLARQFSRFGYEPSTDQIHTGPYQICVTDAVAHARQLTAAVHAAVQAYEAASGAHHPAGDADHGD